MEDFLGPFEIEIVVVEGDSETSSDYSRSVGLWGIKGRVSLVLQARVSLIRTGCLRGELVVGGFGRCVVDWSSKRRYG